MNMVLLLCFLTGGGEAYVSELSELRKMEYWWHKSLQTAATKIPVWTNHMTMYNAPVRKMAC
jgi:hypothetical protein